MDLSKGQKVIVLSLAFILLAVLVGFVIYYIVNRDKISNFMPRSPYAII